LLKRAKRASRAAPRWKVLLGTMMAAVGLLYSNISHFVSHSRPSENSSSAASHPAVSITVSGHEVAVGQMYGGQIIVESAPPRDRSDCPPQTLVSSEARKAPAGRIDRPHPAPAQVSRNASIPAENVEIGPPKPVSNERARDKEFVREVVAFQGGPAYSGFAYSGPEHGIFFQAAWPPFNTYYTD
jgi:hypothetical protein